MQSKFSILFDPPASQPALRGAVRPAGLARLRETVERGRMDGRGAERRERERGRGSSKERHDDCPLSISRVGRGGGGQSLPLPSPLLLEAGSVRPLWAEKRVCKQAEPDAHD